MRQAWRSGSCPPRKRRHPRPVCHRPHAIDHAPHLRLARPVLVQRKAHRLVLQLRKGQLIAEVTLRFVHAPSRRRPSCIAASADPACGAGRLALRVVGHRHLGAEGRRRIFVMRVEIGEARAAVHGGHAERHAHRELGRVHRLRMGHRPEHVRSTSMAAWRTRAVTRLTSRAASRCARSTRFRPSTAGFVCRQQAWNLNKTSARAELSPERSARRDGEVANDAGKTFDRSLSVLTIKQPARSNGVTVNPSTASLPYGSPDEVTGLGSYGLTHTSYFRLAPASPHASETAAATSCMNAFLSGDGVTSGIGAARS